MKYRKIRDIEVSAIGFGIMGMSHGYGNDLPNRSEMIKLIRSSYDECGCTFFDTAEGYGPFHNEILLGEALKPIRDKVIIATKFSPVPIGNQMCIYPEKKTSPKGIRMALEDSMKRLQVDYVDLYYQHRITPTTDLEEVASVMGDLIKEGKIRGWGLSQATAEQIVKANTVTPLTAIESEYSMMERMFEKDVIPLCKELNIGFVPFSPLASGFLSGKYSKDTTYGKGDLRNAITRFNKENIEANQPLLDLIYDFSIIKNATPAQISLAWMLHKEDFIVPIPGTRKYDRLKENLGAADVELTDSEYNELEEELSKIEIHGERTDEAIMRSNY